MLVQKLKEFIGRIKNWSKVNQVKSHKFTLAAAKEQFIAYQDVTFVFQTFNKGSQIREVLRPILDLKPANIILFADGCIDETSSRAHSRLNGKNHLVILANDTHEIKNYRLAITIAHEWSCKYVVLLQDDDIYGDNFKLWLDNALLRMEADPLLAVIGGNGGANVGQTPPKRGDQGLISARFTSWSQDGIKRNCLGDYHVMEVPNISPTIDGSSWEYVASVNRAPQVIRVKTSIDLGFFPAQMEPYQYDDYFNCFTAWMTGHKVLLMPIAGKRGNVGVGGMRLYNSVTIVSRPAHFIDNWNFVYDRFKDPWIDGEIAARVKEANILDLQVEGTITAVP